MNEKLRNEIVRHIFDRFGLLVKETKTIHNFSALSLIAKDKFVLDKKLVFIDEETDRRCEGKIWGASCEIGSKICQVLIADTKDDIPEFSIIIRVDKLSPYGIRLAAEDDGGSIRYCVEHDKKFHWLEANTVIQAKCLIGIESLFEQLLDWKKLKDYKEMYDLLIGFIESE